VARAFAFAGHHGTHLWRATLPAVRAEVGADVRAFRQQRGGTEEYTPTHEFVCKLEELAEDLYTAAARRLATQRHAYMVTFFERLDAEALGQM
jgi:hypothetical protein